MPFVKTARPALPEFDPFRPESETRPEWRARNRHVLEFCIVFRNAIRKIGRVLYRLTLNRSPRANLALARSRRPILVCLFVAHLCHGPFRANLNFERRPVEADRCPGASP